MAEMPSKQPWFTYSACSLFPKNKKQMEKFNETKDTYENTG